MDYQPLGSRYLLEEPIGQGGMGVVWRGRDRVVGDVCAIKVLRPELAADPSAVTRFVRERTALAKFRLPYSFTEGAGQTTVEIYCWRADAGIGYCSNISLRALG